MLDDPQTYTKPAGSSTTLVAVRILASTLTKSLGTKVKPGTFERNNCLKLFISSQNSSILTLIFAVGITF